MYNENLDRSASGTPPPPLAPSVEAITHASAHGHRDSDLCMVAVLQEILYIYQIIILGPNCLGFLSKIYFDLRISCPGDIFVTGSF